MKDDSRNEDPELLGLLAAARDDLPAKEQLRGIGVGLERTLSAGAGGATGLTGGTVLTTKIAIAVLGVAAAVTGSVALWPSGEVSTDVPRIETQARRPVVEQVSPVPTTDPIPLAQPEPQLQTHEQRAPAHPRGLTPSVTPQAEVRLLRRAQDLLSASPERALALLREHERRFPEGMLAQEREVLAIDAMMRTGRTQAARARATHFYAHYPHSSHQRRIGVLIEASGE